MSTDALNTEATPIFISDDVPAYVPSTPDGRESPTASDGVGVLPDPGPPSVKKRGRPLGSKDRKPRKIPKKHSSAAAKIKRKLFAKTFLDPSRPESFLNAAKSIQVVNPDLAVKSVGKEANRYVKTSEFQDYIRRILTPDDAQKRLEGYVDKLEGEGKWESAADVLFKLEKSAGWITDKSEVTHKEDAKRQELRRSVSDYLKATNGG